MSHSLCKRGAKEKNLVRKSKTKVITDGVDLDSFLPRSLSEARSKLGITENARVLLFNADTIPRSNDKTCQIRLHIFLIKE